MASLIFSIADCGHPIPNCRFGSTSFSFDFRLVPSSYVVGFGTYFTNNLLVSDANSYPANSLYFTMSGTVSSDLTRLLTVSCSFVSANSDKTTGKAAVNHLPDDARFCVVIPSGVNISAVSTTLSPIVFDSANLLISVSIPDSLKLFYVWDALNIVSSSGSSGSCTFDDTNILTAVNSLSSDLTIVKNRLPADLTSLLTTLQTSVNTAITDIGNLDCSGTGGTTDLTPVLTAVSNVSTKVDNVNTVVSDVKTDTNSVLTRVPSDLNTKLTTLQTSVNTAITDIGNLDCSGSGTGGTTDLTPVLTAISDVKTDTTSVLTRVPSDLNTKLTTLQTSVNGLSSGGASAPSGVAVPSISGSGRFDIGDVVNVTGFDDTWSIVGVVPVIVSADVIENMYLCEKGLARVLFLSTLLTLSVTPTTP